MLKISKGSNAFLIEVYGTVQGLGFRPFVYNLAVKNNLTGFVCNTGIGVQITACGKKCDLKKFVLELRKSDFDAEYFVKEIVPKKFLNFTISKSKKTEIISDFPYDLALCNDCRKELFSNTDRRYLYPFINCIKCGPRFSIIKKLPYDRKNTTMNKFSMCGDCLREYNNSSNRRLHAQPNACHKCGPKLSLFTRDKELLSYRNQALTDSVKFLKTGKILAVKSIGGYHLCCDASNPRAVNKLRKRKQRPHKPFAVMTNIRIAENLCFINKYEKAELLSKSAPIVLLKKKVKIPMLDMLAPDNSSLGIMLPYAPLHYLLMEKIPLLVMTSGNKIDEPISINEKEAFENLNKTADYFLTHDRDIENRADDSIVKFLPGGKEKIIIRRSRGYVPMPVKTGIGTDMFAAGGDLKNNFCFIRKGNAYLSQYVGDLAENANLKFYSESINKMKSFLDINPMISVCDAHPTYYSSLYAKQHYKKVNFVWHHYAHMASVIVEHNLNGDVLGFIFDGNGYGEDGNIWGGEFILYSKQKFKRAGHFGYFCLPGGDVCVKEVWRLAVSLLYKYNLLQYMPTHLKKYDYKTIIKIIENNVNSPLTSSAGRIFDAVSSLLGIKNISTFEAEAAIALESAADTYKTSECYGYNIENGIIDISKLLKGILENIKSRIPVECISAKFHNTIADIVVKTAKKHKIKQIALGGGVFQNVYLLNSIGKKLLSLGFDIYYNKQIPINDGGLCLGQAYINNLILKNKNEKHIIHK
ncbi:MAG: carbamoyltransferase HypF [Endomicrobium sp.]|jgi:hydrogenase maturation protein HypF|nr:carbamoyltransferase HypF [Endomicrobium sp.]